MDKNQKDVLTKTLMALLFVTALTISAAANSTTQAATTSQPAQITYSFRVIETVETAGGIRQTGVAQGVVTTVLGRSVPVRIALRSSYLVCVTRKIDGPCETEQEHGEVAFDLLPELDSKGGVATLTTLRFAGEAGDPVSQNVHHGDSFDSRIRLISPRRAGGKQYQIEIEPWQLAM